MSIAFARWWVVVSALLIAAGWVLSALHTLNRTGYTIVLALIAIAAWLILRGGSWRMVRLDRFRRWLPLSFASICLLVALSGLLHAPNNFDALSYRIPRTLHWLAEGHWHWIETNYERVNVRSQGTEWMMAPLLLFTHTDRTVWLLNFLPFLALPGLVFSVFIRAGVSPRSAWRWMWLLPCGYGIAGQAGGSGNDLPGVFFALAAVDFALRARSSGGVRDLWLSALAAAAMTATKLSNAPLLLVWLAAAWPARHLVFQRPLASTGMAVIALLASFLPGVILNVKYCGDWTGAAAELPTTKQARPIGLIFAANTINFAATNFAPPIFPWARRWNDWAADVLPDRFLDHVRRVYPQNYAPTDLPELHSEDWAGLGLGLSALLAAHAIVRKKRRGAPAHQHRALHLAPWAALGVMLWMIPVTSVPRMALPYYPLLALAILAGPWQRRWECSGAWRALAGFAVATCLLELAISPSRPILPMTRVLSSLQAQHPSPTLERALLGYEVYAGRTDALAAVRALLPDGVRRFGLVTHNDLETSLWRPFGSREFVHTIPGTTRTELLQQDCTHLVINIAAAEFILHDRLDAWLAELDLETQASVEIRTLATGAPTRWVVARLRAP